MASKLKTTVLDDPQFGWWSREGEPPLMGSAHRHNELELNLLQSGSIVYMFPGRRIELKAGQMFFFWSAVPHQLIEKCADASIHWMTIPLLWLVQRSLPERLTRSLLEGRPLVGEMSRDGQAADLAAFQRWHDYLETDEGEGRTILTLEVEARLRRFVYHSKESHPEALESPTGKAEQIAHFLAEHFADAWAVKEAARSANLHPNYAMTLFRRAYGISMVSYVTQLRVALAQQLLVSSDMDVLQVGFESGFGSTSRFYAAFKSQTGQTPHSYRSSLKWSNPK
jgi:AraC-like DNA-binding protein